MFGFLLDMIPNYLVAASKPNVTCEGLLSCDVSARISKCLNISLSALILTCLIQLPLYWGGGMRGDGLIGFYVLSVTVELASVIVFGFGLHLILMGCKVRSAFLEILTMWVTYFIVYWPIIAIATYCCDMEDMDVVRAAHSRGMSLGDALGYLLTRPLSHTGWGGAVEAKLSMVGSYALIVIASVSATMMARKIVERYGASRRRSFLGVGFAMAVGLVPVYCFLNFLLFYYLFTFSA